MTAELRDEVARPASAQVRRIEAPASSATRWMRRGLLGGAKSTAVGSVSVAVTTRVNSSMSTISRPSPLPFCICYSP
jgi:hypothetical protein